MSNPANTTKLVPENANLLKRRSLRLKGGTIPTVHQITHHRYTQLARSNWSKPIFYSPDKIYKNENPQHTQNDEIPSKDYNQIISNNSSLKQYKPSIIEEIYDELKTSRFDLSRLMILEFSQYFENYLWPFFHSKESTKSHVLSLVLMCNEKIRQNLPIWDAFKLTHLDAISLENPKESPSTNPIKINHEVEKLPTQNLTFISSKFKRFFYRVLFTYLDEETATLERREIVKFLICCFQSLEQDMVRRVCLSVCGPSLWSNMSENVRTHFFDQHPTAKLLWEKTNRKFSKIDLIESLSQIKFESNQDTFINIDRLFFSQFLDLFDELINLKIDGDIYFDEILHIERMVEFLIDLISQLPTRRMLLPLIRRKNLIVKCRQSIAYSHTESSLFKQLCDILNFYINFEINNETGQALSHHEYTELHYKKVQEFQKTCFLNYKDIPALYKAALTNISAIDSPEKLKVLLNDLKLVTLYNLCEELFLIDSKEFKAPTFNDDDSIEAQQMKNREWRKSSKKFLIAVLIEYLEKRSDQLQQINETPLYPSEELIWDPNLVPAEHYHGDYTLALPKLNLQFLTIHDYLLRNFNLYRLESAYEIREDLEDAIYRKRCRYSASGDIEFAGQARMAIEIENFTIIQVEKPNIGSTVPSEVRAEIVINMSKLKQQTIKEWDSLRQFDVMFMAAIVPPIEPYTGNLSDLVDVTDFPEKFGVISIRGCEVIELLDEEGKTISDQNPHEFTEPKGFLRTVRVFIDPSQYQSDLKQMENEGFEDFFGAFNLLIRRKPKENNFKAVLETIRNLMNRSEQTVIPSWLHDLFLGYGDPGSAQFNRLPTQFRHIDFIDTFLDINHLKESFPNSSEIIADDSLKPPFTVQFELQNSTTKNSKNNDLTQSEIIRVKSYQLPNIGPYPECERRNNTIRFTPIQVQCIRAGVNPGLTIVVGPPGTGKTDTAVQIVNLLFHNFPEERILLVAHSNQALNDLFEKIVNLDISERYLLRLGIGEMDLHSDKDFSKWGRVNFMLQRRLELLAIVERLSQSLHLVGDFSYTCETASHFYHFHILSRIEKFQKYTQMLDSSDTELKTILHRWFTEDSSDYYNGNTMSSHNQTQSITTKSEKNEKETASFVVEEDDDENEPENQENGVTNATSDSPYETMINNLLDSYNKNEQSISSILFPFHEFFSDAPQPLFTGTNKKDKEIAENCFMYIKNIFDEIEECLAFELLRNSHDRGQFLLTKHSRIIAMTCTHAALIRQNLVDMKFKYDSLIMEEAAQILEVETFIPMLLQQTEHGVSRLKRVVLIGDHHQLPPIIQNRAFQQYGKLDQSLFARFVRLQVPTLQLDFQGRARPEIADLYSWEYEKLHNLPNVLTNPEYHAANAGFGLTHQFIEVGNYNDIGETAPLPHFYQNLGEGEFAVAIFMYMRILGYPAEKITILTTYNGQKALIEDIIQQRCAWNPAIGWPNRISTVDKYQGQQNDYIILSLVRTERVGHLRDVRRLIVAMSRAKLGLYVLGRWSLFNNCFELIPVMNKFATKPIQLSLVNNEWYPTTRPFSEASLPIYISDATQMFEVVQSKAKEKVEMIKQRSMGASSKNTNDLNKIESPPNEKSSTISKEAQQSQPNGYKIPPPPPSDPSLPSKTYHSPYQNGPPPPPPTVATSKAFPLMGTPAFRLPTGLMGFFNPRPLPMPGANKTISNSATQLSPPQLANLSSLSKATSRPPPPPPPPDFVNNDAPSHPNIASDQEPSPKAISNPPNEEIPENTIETSTTVKDSNDPEDQGKQSIDLEQSDDTIPDTNNLEKVVQNLPNMSTQIEVEQATSRKEEMCTSNQASQMDPNFEEDSPNLIIEDDRSSQTITEQENKTNTTEQSSPKQAPKQLRSSRIKKPEPKSSEFEEANSKILDNTTSSSKRSISTRSKNQVATQTKTNEEPPVSSKRTRIGKI